MTDNEIDARRAMLMAVHEIQSLRQQNAILGAKVEVLDVFRVALLGQPRGGTAWAKTPCG